MAPVPTDEALRLLPGRRSALRAFVRRNRVRTALIPSREIVFAVLGDPHGRFELAWFADGDEFHLGDIARARGLTGAQASAAMSRLRWVFRSSAAAPRHGIVIAGRHVDVISSEHLAAELRRVVTEVLA